MKQPNKYGDTWWQGYDQYVGTLSLDTEGAVRFLTKHACGGKVLELGVGTGRVALPLALALDGIEVHGIEASTKMIELLSAKDLGKVLKVHNLDYSSFVIDEVFSLIYAPFNALAMLPEREDQIECIRCVVACMEQHSKLVVELDVPDLASYMNNMKMHVVDLGPNFIEIQVSHHARITQRIDSHHIVLGHTDRPSFRHLAMRYLGLSELDLMAQVNGLKLIHRFADWRETPFSQQSRKHISVYELS